MNYLEFLSSKNKLKSKDDIVKLIDYRFVIQKQLWEKITNSIIDMKEFFPSQSSEQFSDFLQWMFLNSFNYDWRLYGYVIKYLHYKKHSLNSKLITNLLVHSANKWGSDNILESNYLFLYFPNEDKLSVLYEKSYENNLKSKIQICRCDNFEKYQSTDLSSCKIFYSISNDLTYLFKFIEFF